MVARLRNRLFAAIMRQEVGFFDSNRKPEFECPDKATEQPPPFCSGVGELLSRLGSDVTILKDTVTTNISIFLRSTATVLGGVAYLLVLNWRLALVLLAIVPLTAIGASVYGRYVRGLSKDTRKALAAATEVAEESIGAVRTVRAFANEPRQQAQYAVKIEESLQLGIKTAYAYGLFSGGMQGFTTLAFTGIVWYGGHLVLQGQLTVGTLTSFLLYALQIGGSLGMLASLFGNLMQAVGANDRVFQLLDRTPRISVSGGHTLERAAITGMLRLQHVDFSYPTRPDVLVLKNFSLDLQPGKVTALVGPSGGGKSTVAALMEGFYFPNAGSVCVDGHDLRELDGSWWRKQVGMVRQEPVLFHCSIADNIRFSKATATDEQIVEACKIANAHDFIMSFPDGYETQVGERGVRLSGGQKQRIAIARAVCADPSICIFDEASSALDAESEHLVHAALDRLMHGRTVLVIAHRLSTVRNADVVVVVNEGQVAATGTHEELLQHSALYSQLVARQLAAGDDSHGQQ